MTTYTEWCFVAQYYHVLYFSALFPEGFSNPEENIDSNTNCSLVNVNELAMGIPKHISSNACTFSDFTWQVHIVLVYNHSVVFVSVTVVYNRSVVFVSVIVVYNRSVVFVSVIVVYTHSVVFVSVIVVYNRSVVFVSVIVVYTHSVVFVSVIVVYTHNVVLCPNAIVYNYSVVFYLILVSPTVLIVLRL